MATPAPDYGERKKTPLRASHVAKKAYPSRYHSLCRRCKQTCKQTRYAKVITCPQFEAKDAK